MRYLSFLIEDREFGIPLTQVREVIAFPEISSMPNMSKHFLGITNLRDQIIPILDLRLKFKAVQTLTHETAVIICKLEKGQVGIVVDCIHGVSTPATNEILPMEHLQGEEGNASPVNMVVMREGKLCLIVDVMRTLSVQELDVSAFDGIKSVA